jgi:hypothetical protein
VPTEAETISENHFFQLIESGQYEQAVQYASSFPTDEPKLTSNNPHIHICMAYALWGKGQQAIHHCQEVTNRSEWPLYLECSINRMRRKRLHKPQCTENLTIRDNLTHWSTSWGLKHAEAIAYYRLHYIHEASRSMDIVHQLYKTDDWFIQLSSIIIDSAMRGEGPEEKLRILRETIPEDGQREAFDILRRDLLYGGPHTAIHRASRDIRIFYFEHPLGKASPYLAIAAALFAGLIYVARRPLWYGVLGFIAATRSIGYSVWMYARSVASAFRVRAHERRKTRIETASASVQPAPIVSLPTTATMPIPYPAVWQAGYMNRAYQFAAWCYASLWFLLALPLVLMMAIPALTILLDFSTNGMRAAAENVKGFATGFRDNWGQLWFGLLLLAFTGFSAFKIYGRYTLPKPFRPKIRVVRTTIRVVFLVTTALSVGTILMYFSKQAGEIYQNPLVRMAIKYLRDLLWV